MSSCQLYKLALPILFIGCGGGESASALSEDDSLSKAPSEVLKITHQEILFSMNQVREQARDCHDGLGIVGPVNPLVWNDTLYAAAHEHSADLANSNTFSHVGSGTEHDITGSRQGSASLYYERIAANGYTNYHAVGENIAGGQESIDEVLEALLESPEHCKNLMSANFTEVGVAIVVNPDADYAIYWTQNFGSKQE